MSLDPCNWAPTESSLHGACRPGLKWSSWLYGRLRSSPEGSVGTRLNPRALEETAPLGVKWPHSKFKRTSHVLVDEMEMKPLPVENGRKRSQCSGSMQGSSGRVLQGAGECSGVCSPPSSRTALGQVGSSCLLLKTSGRANSRHRDYLFPLFLWQNQGKPLTLHTWQMLACFLLPRGLFSAASGKANECNIEAGTGKKRKKGERVTQCEPLKLRGKLFKIAESEANIAWVSFPAWQR